MSRRARIHQDLSPEDGRFENVFLSDPGLGMTQPKYTAMLEKSDLSTREDRRFGSGIISLGAIFVNHSLTDFPCQPASDSHLIMNFCPSLTQLPRSRLNPRSETYGAQRA